MPKNQLNLLDLNDLCKTSLIPLWVRWKDFQSNEPILSDKFSFDILENSNFDTSVFDKVNPFVKKYTELGIIIRETIFDNYLNYALSQNPNSIIINLACGLDARHKRIKSYQKWIDIDLEQIINIKSNIFKNDNYEQIIHDMFQLQWIKNLHPKQNYIIMCEGTLMYFSEEKILSLINKINKTIPSNVMILEIMGSLGKNRIHPFVKRLQLANKYLWGISNLNWFRKNNLQLIEYSSFLDYHQKKWGLIGNLVNLSNILKLNIASQIYYIKNE